MDSNTILKYKNKKYKDLKKTAVKWFNKFIRLRDCDENGYAICISSGQSLRYGSPNYHAGHFIPAGSCEALRFNEDNVHGQGKSDNYWKSANLIEYRKRLIEKIGLRKVQELEFIKDQYKKISFKRTRISLIEVIETYKAKCKELEQTKNFKI